MKFSNFLETLILKLKFKASNLFYTFTSNRLEKNPTLNFMDKKRRKLTTYYLSYPKALLGSQVKPSKNSNLDKY
jgi:hypothetical protein